MVRRKKLENQLERFIYSARLILLAELDQKKTRYRKCRSRSSPGIMNFSGLKSRRQNSKFLVIPNQSVFYFFKIPFPVWQGIHCQSSCRRRHDEYIAGESTKSLVRVLWCWWSILVWLTAVVPRREGLQVSSRLRSNSTQRQVLRERENHQGRSRFQLLRRQPEILGHHHRGGWRRSLYRFATWEDGQIGSQRWQSDWSRRARTRHQMEPV